MSHDLQQQLDDARAMHKGTWHELAAAYADVRAANRAWHDLLDQVTPLIESLNRHGLIVVAADGGQGWLYTIGGVPSAVAYDTAAAAFDAMLADLTHRAGSATPTADAA